MVLEGLIEGLTYFAHPIFLLGLTAGVIVGLILGIMPGIGGIVGMAVVLPFVWKVPGELALPFMLAMSAVGFTGGAITAILVNIPGTEPNAATLIDGFPMNQKGEGGRAIGAAVTSSAFGGIVAVGFALLMVPLVLPIVMKFNSPELAFVVLLGISFIAVVGGRSTIKGLISGGLGLIASFIGFQATSGVARFTFGSLYLYDGIAIVPVALGLFAIPSMLSVASSGVSITQVRLKGMKNVVQGAKDVFRHPWLWFRSSLIGYITGLVPGVGAQVACWVAYGQAKQFSRNPEKFGTGCVEGVIAPESANNAKEGGALLTTLAIGVPGSTAMIFLIAAFLMLGIIPGPALLTVHLGLSMSLIIGVAAANLMAGVICFWAAPHLAKLATIRAHILFPLVIIIAIVGTYAAQARILDIFMLLLIAVLGVFMDRFGYSKPAFVLGFILGYIFEKYFFLSLGTSGPLFWVRPIPIIIIVIIIGLFSLNYLKRIFKRFNWRFKRT